MVLLIFVFLLFARVCALLSLSLLHCCCIVVNAAFIAVIVVSLNVVNLLKEIRNVETDALRLFFFSRKVKAALLQ